MLSSYLSRASAAVFAIASLFGTAAQAEHAYVANNSANTVSVIDTATNIVSATIVTGNNPNGVAITPDGDKAYVSNETDGTVAVLSTATNAVLGTITTGGSPNAAIVSPDGSTVYVANNGNDQIEVIETATDTLRTTVTANGEPVGLAITPDGSTLYAADRTTNDIQVISTATLLTTSRIPVGLVPIAVAVAPDGQTAYAVNGNFYAGGTGSVSVIDVATASVTATIQVGNQPLGIVLTPDGRTAYVINVMDSTASVIDTASRAVTATFPAGLAPNGIAITPDGSSLYVTASIPQGIVTVIDRASEAITATVDVGAFPGAVAITPARAAPLASAVLPGSRSVQVGTAATIFATILNAGATPVTGCYIALPGSAPASLGLTYQTTDPMTNEPTGQPNTPVGIGADNAYQTFVLSFTSATALSAQAQPLVFACSGAEPAAPVPGVNTVDLIFSTTPIPDIIALAAVATGDGTVHIANGVGAFAVATVDAGAAGSITASADTGSATLPVTTSLCQTSNTGQCLAPPAATVPVSYAAGATPTFSVFVSSSGSVPFSPGTSRIFVRFEDADGISHGSTSVAVTTQ